jgi:hypothetical protein
VNVPPKIAFLIAPFLFNGCSETRGICTDYIRSMPKAPSVEASKAVKNGDYRLLSIRTFTNIVPAVEDNNLVKQLGIKIIEHTSDNWPDESCRQYQKMAFEHAKKYNAYIIGNYDK